MLRVWELAAVRTDTRSLLRIHHKSGIATLAHFCAVPSASAASFGRTVLANTYCVGAKGWYDNGREAAAAGDSK